MLAKVMKLLMLSLMLFITATAQNFNDDKMLLLEARERIWAFEPAEKVVPLLSECKSHFAMLSDSCERLYWLSNTEFLFGMVQMGKNNKLSAIQNFETAKNLISEALQCKTFTDGYALLSEIYVQLMWCRGVVYQLKNINKMRDIPGKALDMDSTNIKARQSLAVYYMNAPQVLGGNINKAIELLANINTTSKTELFATYYILGNAYIKKQDFESAIRYIQMALSLYPQNRWALEDLDSVNQSMKHNPNS